MRNRSKKTREKNIIIVSAFYVCDFTIAITFSSGITHLVNFLPLFEKYVKGDNLKYFAPERFKKFIVKKGNIYWGKNEDESFQPTFYTNIHQPALITLKKYYISSNSQ